MRRAAKRDTAEAGIVEALEAGGASVVRLSGRDVPDLLVGLRGATYLAEVKTVRPTREGGAHPVSAGQRTWHDGWRGTPVLLLRTVDQAVAFLRMAP